MILCDTACYRSNIHDSADIDQIDTDMGADITDKIQHEPAPSRKARRCRLCWAITCTSAADRTFRITWPLCWYIGGKIQNHRLYRTVFINIIRYSFTQERRNGTHDVPLMSSRQPRHRSWLEATFTRHVCPTLSIMQLAICLVSAQMWWSYHRDENHVMNMRIRAVCFDSYPAILRVYEYLRVRYGVQYEQRGLISNATEWAIR